MGALISASDQDLRALAAIVSQDRPDLPDGDGLLPPSLLADLASQIRCDAVSVEHYDVERHVQRWLQGSDEEDDDACPSCRSRRPDPGATGPGAAGAAAPPPVPGLPRCRAALSPGPRLTPRQNELLRLLSAGRTNHQIARRLGISEGTVRTHLEHIYEKLGVSSRTAAVARAFPGRAA
jgi:DNA-binding CsgD family transcriptional regulator